MIEQDKRDPLAVNSSVGLWLYQTLVAPVADSMPPGSRVVIVPDGPLHNLNFETLLVAKPALHYWIQDATISVAPSLSLLNGSSKRTSTERSLLLMGAPVTDGSGFLPLPQAALEIEQVSRHFKPGQTKSYVAAAATPEAYLAAEPSASQPFTSPRTSRRIRQVRWIQPSFFRNGRMVTSFMLAMWRKRR